MVDKDMSEINALNEVFPESDVLLCWYHVLQVIYILRGIYKYIFSSHFNNNNKNTLHIFWLTGCCSMVDEVRFRRLWATLLTYPERSSRFLQKMKACAMVVVYVFYG